MTPNQFHVIWTLTLIGIGSTFIGYATSWQIGVGISILMLALPSMISIAIRN